MEIIQEISNVFKPINIRLGSLEEVEDLYNVLNRNQDYEFVADNIKAFLAKALKESKCL